MAVVPLHDDYPTRRAPVVTYALIAINVVVYLASPLASLLARYGTGATRECARQTLLAKYGAISKELISGHQLGAVDLGRLLGACVPPPFHKVPWLSVLSSMFLHGSASHLLGNMLFLFVFGHHVEDRFGHVRYLLGYLAFGYVGTYAFALTSPTSTDPLIGASGAIAGVLGAYIVLHPRGRVTSLVVAIPFRLPAWVLLGSWFALQWLSLRGPDSTVAYAAHVYGFLAGACVGLALRLSRRSGIRVVLPGWR